MDPIALVVVCCCRWAQNRMQTHTQIYIHTLSHIANIISTPLRVHGTRSPESWQQAPHTRSKHTRATPNATPPPCAVSAFMFLPCSAPQVRIEIHHTPHTLAKQKRQRRRRKIKHKRTPNQMYQNRTTTTTSVVGRRHRRRCRRSAICLYYIYCGRSV